MPMIRKLEYLPISGMVRLDQPNEEKLCGEYLDELGCRSIT